MRNISIYSYLIGFDTQIIKKACNELNEEQDLFKVTPIYYKLQNNIFENNSSDINNFYKSISYPVKKHYKLSNLITITDIKIYLDENTSVGTHFSNSYRLGIITWNANSTIPLLKYQLLKMSIQLSSQKYLQHNNEGCFFDNDIDIHNTSLCLHCENQLLSSGYSYREIFSLIRMLEKIKSNFESGQQNYMFALIIMDIVSYSKYTDQEQRKLIVKLQNLIKSNNLTKKFINDLIFDPIGDGCIIALSENLIRDSIKYCADIQKSIAKSGLKVRFGLNYGSIFRYRDINQNINVAGSGINLAARVMDIGDANHILVNRPLFDALGNLDDWHRSIFHNIGFVKVKHNVKLEVFNVYSKEEGFGNSDLPKKLKETHYE